MMRGLLAARATPSPTSFLSVQSGHARRLPSVRIPNAYRACVPRSRLYVSTTAQLPNARQL